MAKDLDDEQKKSIQYFLLKNPDYEYVGVEFAIEPEDDDHAIWFIDKKTNNEFAKSISSLKRDRDLRNIVYIPME